MADRIELRGLRVLARCGVSEAERDQDQPIEVDVDLVTHLRVAGASDDLADTIDYGAVCAAVEQAVGSGPAALLEHLAERIAQTVLRLDRRINGVELVVRKLRPPVPQHLATAAVRISRDRT
jgi:dihydroneopterin aldolase